MASPSVRVSTGSNRATDRSHRRRIGLLTDIAVIATVALFVAGAIAVGLIQLHAGLTGR